MKPHSPWWAALALVLLPGATATAQTPRALDLDAYQRWSRIHSEVLAPGGGHAAWVVEPDAAPGRLVIRALDRGGSLVLPRGHAPRFSADGRRLWATVVPHRRAGTAAAASDADGLAPPRETHTRSGPDVPSSPDTLVLVDLERAFARPGEGVRRIPGAGGARAPERAGRWLAYLLPGGGPPGAGRTLSVLDLATERERRIEDVTLFRFSDDGSRLWYVTGGDALWLARPGEGRGRRILAAPGRVRHMALDSGGERVAALVQGERRGAAERWTLWRADASGNAARLAGPFGEGLPRGRVVSDGLAVRFSPDGRRVLFGTTAAPGGHDTDDPAVAEVRVDVWSWTDAELQTEQMLRGPRRRERAYLAVVPWAGGPAVQLEDEAVPDVTLSAGGDGDVALGVTDLPYRRRASWDERYVDVYRVDVRTGARERILTRVRGRARLSPTGRWAAWWDGEARTWRALDLRSGRRVVLGARIPTALHDELDDRPAPPRAYGLAGWTAGDERVVLYDRYDVWAVDPQGAAPPRNLTEGLGRRERMRLRYVDLERGVPVEWQADALLSAFREDDKRAGFYRDRFAGADEPERLVLGEHHWGTPLGAPGTDRLLVTRESFRESPDIWMAGDGFTDLRRLSDANPQQRDYRWGSAELVSWTSASGTPIQGILYRPEGFDPTRRHPMIVTLYERSSDELHRYQTPDAGGVSLNRSVYASRGYLVFVPDIPYEVGHPGRSALDAVVPGVEALVERGFVDPDRIGLQGHSWGGYQVAYLITRTDLFAAAQAGAPVVNMTSAYGAIRDGSGLSRMFQYEAGQSRIGATLWDGLDLYVENSPLFEADRIETPLLMLHNDGDTAVPWEQGIEMFLALRRLGKPAWLLNYNGEAHGLRREANRRDWALRMRQFFDHYLKGEAPPVWMVEGVPASRKGATLGLDLVDDGAVPAPGKRSGGRR